MRLAIDWDGCCVPQAYPGQPWVWLPGARKTLIDIHADGHWITIFTCRVSPYEFPFSPKGHTHDVPRGAGEVVKELAYIRGMLDQIKLYDVEIWQRPYKPPVDFYLDDKTPGWQGLAHAWKAIR